MHREAIGPHPSGSSAQAGERRAAGQSSPSSTTRSTRSSPTSVWVIQRTARRAWSGEHARWPGPARSAWSRCAVGSSSTSTGWSASSERAIADPGPLAAGDGRRDRRPARCRAPSGSASSQPRGGPRRSASLHLGVGRRRGGRAGRSRRAWWRTRAGRRRPARPGDVRRPGRGSARASAPMSHGALRRGRGSAAAGPRRCSCRIREAPTSATRSPGPRSQRCGRRRGARPAAQRARAGDHRHLGGRRAMRGHGLADGRCGVGEPGEPRAAASVRTESAPASASGPATSASASGSSTSSADSGPVSRPSATAGAATPAVAATADAGRGEHQARAAPVHAPARRPASPTERAHGGHPVGRARRSACHIRSSVGDLDGVDARRRRARPGLVTRSRSARAAPARATSRAAAAGDQAASAARTSPATGRNAAATADEITATTDEGAHRHPDPQRPVDHAVDVVDDGGEHVAAAAAEPAGHQRDDGVVDLHAASGEQPQRGVVRAQPLDVAQRRAGPGRRYAPPTMATSSVSTAGLGRGLHDQPAGRGGERHPGRPRRAHRARWRSSGRSRGSPSVVRRRAGIAGRDGGRDGRRSGAPAPRVRAVGTAAGVRTRPGGRRAPPAPAGGRRPRRRACRPSSTSVSAMTCSVSSSRWAVGSSSSTQGRSATHDPGQGQAGPFAGGEGGAVLAQDGVQPVGQGAHALLERDLAQGGPQGVVGGARARPAAGCRRPCRSRSTGRWGSQATWACHAAPPTAWPPAVTRPDERQQAGRAPTAGWTCRSRTGPVTTVTPRAGITACSGASAGTVRPG